MFRDWLQAVYDAIKDKVTAEELQRPEGSRRASPSRASAEGAGQWRLTASARSSLRHDRVLNITPQAAPRRAGRSCSRRSGTTCRVSIGSMLVGAGDRHRRRRRSGPMAGGLARSRARLLCRHHALDPAARRARLGLLRLSAADRALARCRHRRRSSALGIHLGAYVAETIRAGLTSVRPRQMRAALALGMSRLAGDPHHHPAAGADPHAAGARLAVRHRDQGQRHRLGHRGAGAHAPDPDRSPARPTARSSSTPQRCSSISCSAIRWRAAVDRALPPPRAIWARHDLRLERRLGQPAAAPGRRLHDHLAHRGHHGAGASPAGSSWRCCGCRRLASVSAPATAFVEFFRATPLILQIYWAFYVLPAYFDMQLSQLSHRASSASPATSRPSTRRRSAPASSRSAKASGMPGWRSA